MRTVIAMMVAFWAGGALAAADCVTTPPLQTQNYPGASSIPNGNDLLQPAGKAVAAEGQRVVIYGTLLDRNCVPVSGAIVELWQVDPFGKWMLATREDRVNPNPVFAGAGRTATMNNGSFSFTTAFPAAIGKQGPRFNVRVKYPGQKDFSTILFFGKDGRNASDPVYAKLNGVDKDAVSLRVNEGEESLNAAITLVLPYKVPYRGY